MSDRLQSLSLSHVAWVRVETINYIVMFSPLILQHAGLCPETHWVLHIGQCVVWWHLRSVSSVASWPPNWRHQSLTEAWQDKTLAGLNHRETRFMFNCSKVFEIAVETLQYLLDCKWMQITITWHALTLFFVSEGTVGSNSNSMGLANWLDAWRPREISKTLHAADKWRYWMILAPTRSWRS